MLKENIIKLLGLSEDDRKPLIKWFDAFEKELKRLKGSYSKVKPTDMLALYYDDIDPKEAAAQLKESTLSEASPKIKYAKIVKGIRDSQGPFSVVATKNGKVVAQKNSIKNSKMLPIEVNTMADAHPGATIGIESKGGEMLNTFKESVELDEANYGKPKHMARHKKALQIIKFIDSVEKHKEKWTDSYGDYVTPKLNKNLDVNGSGGVEYQQGRGRGDWNFVISSEDTVLYNNRNMPWMPKSGELPYNKFMELLDTWKKNANKPKSTGGHMGRQTESVELDEKSFRDFDVPASPEIKKWIESGRARILMSTDSTLGGNSQFVIIENPNFRNAKISGEDKVLMFTISDPKRGRIKMFSFHGSHVNVKGAMKFAKNNKLVTGWIHNLESVERTFRRWEESVEEEPCTTHKRCDKKNKKSLLVNPLRGYPQNETEEEEVKESSDAAGNNVGGGEVAGIAPGEDPPVTKKRKKFAGCDVFEVSPDVYYKCVQGKKKFEHWKRYFDRESGEGSEIYEFAYKYPRKAIIVQNKITQEMVYLRHNRK